MSNKIYKVRFKQTIVGIPKGLEIQVPSTNPSRPQTHDINKVLKSMGYNESGSISSYVEVIG